MRRFLPIALLTLALPAIASQPGQPLDCSDMSIMVPGLSCVPLAPFDQPDSPYIGYGPDMVFDNEGYQYVGIRITSPDGIEIQRTHDGGQTHEVVARTLRRSAPQGWDSIRFTNHGDSAFSGDTPRILFDAAGGRLLVWITSYCEGSCVCGSSCFGEGYGGKWVSAIQGLATTFDVLQTFTPPSVPQLGFRVPYMPEGMGGADHFDTYWGDLATVGDWSKAKGLQCGYPPAPPKVGDYFTVADALPTPAPGNGYYYVTATTYQGQTRYGRKCSGGKLTGRDPAVLPACVQPR